MYHSLYRNVLFTSDVAAGISDELIMNTTLCAPKPLPEGFDIIILATCLRLDGAFVIAMSGRTIHVDSTKLPDQMETTELPLHGRAQPLYQKMTSFPIKS